MHIGSRFTEYGLIGAFFWLAELMVHALAGRADVLAETVASVVKIAVTAAPETQQILTSVASALAVVAVFVTGLLVDLVASSFIIIEMSVFKRHVEQNNEWLEPLLSRNEAYTEDYRRFRDEFVYPYGWQPWRRAFIHLMLWRRDVRAELKKGWVDAGRRWRSIPLYLRLWNFFNAHAAGFVGRAQSYVFVDHYYLWRAARAVAIVMVFTALQLMVLLLPQPDPPGWVVLVMCGMMLLPLAVEQATYSRLCHALFAAIYVAQKAEGNDR